MLDLTRKARAVIVLTICALFLIWIYPSSTVTYGLWVYGNKHDVRVIHKRVWTAELGQSSVYTPAEDDLSTLPRSRWQYPAQRNVNIDWTTQCLQSALVLVAAIGVLWVLGPQASKKVG